MTDSTRRDFVLIAPAACDPALRAPGSSRPARFALMVAATLLVLSPLWANGATAALRDHTVRWAPSSSNDATRYVLSVGIASGTYTTQLDLGLPAEVNGVMESVIEVEDSVDLYAALRGQNVAGYSDFSNEVVIAKVTPPPPPPPSYGVTAVAGLTAPVSGSVSVTASVLPDTQSVRFDVDGAVVGIANGSPFGASFDSTLFTNGAHVLNATAHLLPDAGGTPSPTFSMTFDVDNATGGTGGGGSGGGGGGGSTALAGYVGVLVADTGEVTLVDVDGTVTPLATPNAPNTDVRAAWCDMDGDAESDLILGFGPFSAGRVRVLLLNGSQVKDSYEINAGRYWIRLSKNVLDTYGELNGETYPACGDVDGDGANEIVVGHGGGGGWTKVHVFDDLAHGFSEFTETKRAFMDSIAYGGFSSWDGSAIPAVGDVDGDGIDEIVIGRSQDGDGSIAIFDDATTHFAPLHSSMWFDFGLTAMLVPQLSGGSPDGTAVPALGDVDGDGRDEVVVGLGSGGQGRLFILDDAQAGFAQIPVPGSADGSFQAGWSSYTSGDGRTTPSLADIDDDGMAEVGIGFGPGGEGRTQILDDMSTGFTPHPGVVDPSGVVDTLEPNRIAPALNVTTLP